MKKIFCLFPLFFNYLLLSFASAVYFVQDLQKPSQSNFNSELSAGWSTDTSGPAGYFNTDLSKTFFRFESVNSWTWLQKTFSNLDSHDYISFSLEAFITGGCDGNIIQISLDTVQIQPLVASSLSVSGSNSFFIKGGVPHSGSTVTIKFLSQVRTICPSFRLGIRALSMTLIKNSGISTNQFCNTLGDSPLTPKCGCDLGQYGSPCKDCNPGCNACAGIGGVEICSECDAVNYYSWNGEICEKCALYCDKCVLPMGSDCTTCLGDHFIYGDGTCIEGCPSPMKKVSTGGKIDSCKVPCESSEWLYGDLICRDFCDFEEETDINGVRWCKSPCDDEDDYYYKKTGACKGTCEEPNKAGDIGGIKICQVPCEDSKWLYKDLTCKGFCDFKTKTDENGVKWCKSPCENEEDYFYEDKGVCKGSCPYPNESEDTGGIKTCALGLDEGEKEQVKGMSKGVNGANTGSSGAIAALSFLSSSDSSSIFMGAFSKMLQYIKYMKIVYPAKVELMLEMTKTNSSSTGGFASKMMGDVFDKFPDGELPEKFEYYGVRSNFFVNYWPSLFILLVLGFATGLVILLGLSLQKMFPKISNILGQVTGILKWNMLLLMFCGDFGDIVFFTALELTSAKLNSFESVVSLVICLVINLFAFWVLAQILTVNFNIRKLKPGQLREQEIENKWGNYKTFFAIYKDQSYFQQIFMFIFIIRVSIFNAMIGYFPDYPLFQAILIIVTNLAMFLYLLFKRPMRAMINFIQQVVLEGFLLVFNVCICILAGLDHNEVEAFDFRDNIGEVMVVINIIVPIVSVVILGAKILILGIEAYKEWKAEKLKEMIQREIRIEQPRKQRIRAPEIQIIKENDRSGADMGINQNDNNSILEMSPSDVSFMNNSSHSFINTKLNESGFRLRNSTWNNMSEMGISEHTTSASPYLQPSRVNSIVEMEKPNWQGSPARKFLKQQRIRRNRPEIAGGIGVKDNRLRSISEV